jgi:3-dehydroquinate synthetase
MAELVVAGTTAVWIGRGADATTVLGDVAAERIAYVVQPGIPTQIAGRLAGGRSEALLIPVPDGEAAKSFGVVEAVCERLAAAGFDRTDLLVAVGGGAVTDLGGFVAGVFLRGIRVHYVPTTLLGAVDAAIGGKTGIDLGAKNLVGLFRHPQRVVIDLDTIAGLPRQLLRAGMAEVLKAGLVGDAALVDLLEERALDAPLEETVTRSIAVKAALVAADFHDHSGRTFLNYGHTVGHALEMATGLPHGEAVAIGMVAAGRAGALRCGFPAEQRQRAVLARLGLPAQAPPVDADLVRQLLARDKKRRAGQLRMVLLADIAAPQVVAVDDATVDAALTAVGIGGSPK